MERSADVLAAGLLEVADPSVSSKFFLRQVCLLCIYLDIIVDLADKCFFHPSKASNLLLVFHISPPFQDWMDESDGSEDSIIKHKPLWATYYSTYGKKKTQNEKKKQGNVYRTYGTRVIPV